MEVTYFHSYIDGVDFVFIDSPNFRHLQDNIYRGSREVVIYFCWVEEYFHCWGQREKKCGEKTVLFCELFVSCLSKMIMTYEMNDQNPVLFWFKVFYKLILHCHIFKTAQLPITISLLLFISFWLSSCSLMEQDILKRMVLFCKAAAEVHELNDFSD